MWYYTSGTNEVGPISAEEMKKLVANGTITASTDVWKEGMADWVPASSIKGLLPSQAGGATPPLPGFQDSNPYGTGSHGMLPSNRPGSDLDGMTKGFLIADIVFCLLRGALAAVGLASMGMAAGGEGLGGLIIVSAGVSGLLFLVGTPAAILMLMKKPIGVTLGRITVFLWVLSILEGLATVFLIQVPQIKAQAGGELGMGPLIIGLVVGGGVTLLIRGVLLFFYAKAVGRAGRVINS